MGVWPRRSRLTRARPGFGPGADEFFAHTERTRPTPAKPPHAAANPDLRRFSSRSLMILSIRP